MKKHIWYICSNDTHVKMFQPVSNSVIIKEQLQPTITFVSLDQYYNQGVLKAWNNIASHGTLVHLDRSTPLKQKFYSRNIFFIWHDIIRNIVPGVRRLFSNKPDLVVLGNDRGVIEKIIIQTANKAGVPTLLVQDGMITPSEGKTFKYQVRHLISWPFYLLGFKTFVPTRYGEGNASHIACYGPLSEVLFKERGKSSIRVIGQMRYDVLTSVARTSKSQTLNDSVSVVYFSTPILWSLNDLRGHEQQVKEIQDISNALKGLELPKIKFSVKLHPRESLHDYDRLESLIAKNELSLTNDMDAIDAILDADIVLTSISTTWIETILCNKPCIITNLNYNGSTLAPHIIRRPHLGVVESKETLQQMVLKLALDSKFREDYIATIRTSLDREIMFNANETAVDRLSKFILEIVTNAPPSNLPKKHNF